MVQILIDSEGDLFIPEVEEGISWQTDRFGAPGTLKFSIPKENIGRFEEGGSCCSADRWAGDILRVCIYKEIQRKVGYGRGDRLRPAQVF